MDSKTLHSPWLIFRLCVLAYLVLASYAIARPTVESLFLDSYSSSALPTVWVAVAVAAIFSVAVYNRFASSVPLIRVFRVSLLVILGILLLLLGLRQVDALQSVATFMLYVWKDLYIVVLVETFWSLANTVFRTGMATRIYGLFCVAGSLGGMSANISIGFLAAQFGTENAVFFVFPILGLVWLLVGTLNEFAPPVQQREEKGSSLLEGLRVLKESSYLSYLLALICLVQVVITLVDYQFNRVLEESFPDTDARTAMIGKVYAAIDIGSLTLQLLAAPILKVLGVGKVLMMIPLLMGLIVAAFGIMPSFVVIAAGKVAGKCFDYSLFRAAKEMLYIPLSYREKTQGKAVVDILTYRVAKGGASLMLMGILALGISGWVPWVSLLLVFGWFGVTFVIVQRYRSRRTKDNAEENAQAQEGIGESI